MTTMLPYRATTASGNEYEFEFPLHEATASPVKVAQLLDALLATLDREIRVLGPVGNGDVLQALTLALGVRTRMLPGAPSNLDELVQQLLAGALAAKVTPGAGNVPPGSNPDLH